MSILSVENVSIRYMTGDFKDIGLKEYVMRRLKHNYTVNVFWADKDITFSLEKGDMLGIIGTNGAGKSTLLKVISGIMEPTKGRVRREGTIAALLELGSGFDGDLTVRENTYLRGAMLGYTRKFMDETYDQIIEFAELQDFQDRPFKQLSSGMKSRLAFSIASLVNPDILILDEVLSVGDGAFRKKSEAKMREIIGGGATTILVSHSLNQVRELCTKVLWLEKGQQIAFGDTETICDLYQQYLDKKMTLDQARLEWNDSGFLGAGGPGDDKNNAAGCLEDDEMGTAKNKQALEDERMKAINKQSDCSNIGLPWKKASAPFKTAFAAAIVMGLITHIYMFTNLLLNHDSVFALYYNSSLSFPSGGRWFFPLLDKLSTDFQLPAVIGFLSLLALAVTAGLTVRFLQIESKLGAIITAGFVVMTPAVASTLSYLFCADPYFIALAMSAAAAYLVKKYKHGWIPAIVLLTVSIGTYQAYICYAIGLMLFDCILRLLSRENVKVVIRTGIKYIATVAVSILLWYLISLIVLRICDAAFASYQGFDKMGFGRILDYIRAIPSAYKGFFFDMFDPTVYSAFFRFAQIVFLALIPTNLVYLIISRKLYNNPFVTFLLVVGCCLIPLALNFITVLSIDGFVHLLMRYSFVLIFIFGIKLTEMSSCQLREGIITNGGGGGARYIVSYGLACVLLWNCFCVSNIGYLRMQTVYENSYALSNRIVARIESVEGYSPSMPVVIIGSPLNRSTYGGLINEFTQYDKLTGMNDRLIMDLNNSQERHFIEAYIGLRMPYPNAEQRQAVIDAGLVEDMPVYPADGSVVSYDGMIVVKLSESNKVH